MSTSVLIRKLSRVLCAGALALASFGAAQGNSNPDLPTPQEKLQLPKYCQDGGGALAVCGVFMNHFCPAMVFLNRAGNYSKPKDQRKFNAGRARTDINYTKKNMPAQCPFASDVESADIRLRTIEAFLK